MFFPAISPRVLVLLFVLAGFLHANDAGGGAAGVGANVTLATTSTTATLDNGVIQAVIDKATGRVTSYKLNGTQMVDPSNPIYYSMDGNTYYEQPSGCVYSLVASTSDHVEISCKRTWNATSGYKHVFDIDLHYVLRRGDTGLYAFAILDHPNTYPTASVGEWRIVWKLPRSSTTFTFERAYVDAARNWEMPSYYDYQQAQPTGIGEIVKLTTGVRSGLYDGKYTYSARYSEIGTWGHASNIAKKGVWFVLGGHDYFNDGPTKQDLTSSESYILMHFGRNHYNGSGTSVADGESWRKLFGPFLLYCNSTTATSNAGDVLWADAKAQVAAEKAAWPYSWLATADHPAASARGTVTGRLLVSDPLKPAITGAYANVGLAAAEDTNGNWQFQGKGYQYWTRADASGNFTIPAVRPGSYTLYAFTDGVVGEYSKTSVTVTAGGTNSQGDITWNVSHPGTSIAWEIGTPDRSAKEFRHGDDYFTPYLWDVYTQELPNPLVYDVATSNPATDWNYVHSNHGAGGSTAWDWNVNFQLAAVPRNGNATLTVAIASSNYARLYLYLNGSTSSFVRISPPVDGGNTLLRQGIHAKYSFVRIPIPVSKLRVGSNTFTFRFSGDAGFSSHVMYDYLSLELPEFPPAPPSSGRSIVWTGGTTATANTWDNGLTGSFKENSAATTFGTGDAVTFNDTGSNSTSITLTGTLAANSVAFSGTKNFSLAGTGSLTGTMSLSKSGTSTLTITQANAHSGNNTISGGILSLSNDTANVGGLGTGDVSLENATLRMYSNFNTYNDAPWNLDVPGGTTGTLETDARCDLRGKLTGSGTFRYRLQSGSSRSSIFGDWSGFSGLIEATTISGSAEFRMALDYNWPGLPDAALSLGSGVTAYYAGNLNSGLGTFVSFGELSGTATSTLKGGTVGGREITYRIGARGGDATFAGTLSEQANGLTNLIKTGEGSWTLSGNGNLAGNLIVEAGTLAISGSFTHPATRIARVNAGALMKINGTLNTGTLEISDSGKLTVQGALNGSLTNNGLVELTAGSPVFNGNITNNGYFRVRAPATFSTTGTFTNTGTLNLIGSSQALPPGATNTGVILTDRAPVSLTWTGAGGSDWDLQTSVNWTNAATLPDVFFPGDTVLFDDTAALMTVDLSGTLTPAAVTVASSLSYTFSGGTLAGSAGLTKSGSGSLTVFSTLASTGPVTVSGGKLALAADTAWPAASTLIQVESGAVLDVSALASGAVISNAQTLRGAGTVTGNVSILGNHDPAPGSTFTGGLSYSSSARVSWSPGGNSATPGTYDTTTATTVNIAPGTMLDLVFNTPGSGVDFSQPFWATARSWTVLTATTRSGGFTLGSVGNDALSHAPGSYGAFTLVDSGSSIILNWSPVQIVATWRGTSSADWNRSSLNWDRSGSPIVYQDGILTRLDDGTTVTAINLTESVTPSSLIVDSAKNYTLGGVGAIDGAATIGKNGGGSLTLSTANGFSGGTTVSAGTLAISNANALGTGAVTLSGGIWDTGQLTPPNAVIVTTDSTIIGGHVGGSHGIKTVSGTGTLTLQSTSVFDLEGSLSNFTGRVFLTGTGSFRLNGSNGSAAADFDLGSRTLAARTGGTYNLGSLTGLSTSSLSIASYTGGVVFSIGGNGKSTTYPGGISNGSGTTSVIKTGAGTLTLGGSCGYSGATSVNSGKLLVNGALSNSPVTVSAGATLGGTGTLASATLANGAILAPGEAGAGILTTGPLTLNGGAVSNFELGATSDRVDVTGNLTLNGTLNITDLGGMGGTFTLFTYTGSLSGSGLTLGATPSGSVYALNTSTQGMVLLEITPASFSAWRSVYFSSAMLADPAISGPDGTPAGDGISNLMKYALGLAPGTPSTTGITLATSGGECSITYQRPASRPDLTYTPEVSSDLVNGLWTTAGVIHERLATGDPEVWRGRIAASGGRVFLRLRVTLD